MILILVHSYHANNHFCHNVIATITEFCAFLGNSSGIFIIQLCFCIFVAAIDMISPTCWSIPKTSDKAADDILRIDSNERKSWLISNSFNPSGMSNWLTVTYAGMLSALWLKISLKARLTELRILYLCQNMYPCYYL